MGYILILIGCAVVACAGAYMVLQSREEQKVEDEERRQLKNDFREELSRELRRNKTENFDLAALVARMGLTREEADEVAREFYGRYGRKVFSDGVVTDDERQTLNRLAAAVALPADVAAAIEAKAKGERYQRAVSDAMADGVVTADELDELEELRRSLGIASQDALALTADDARAVYVAEARRIVRNRRFTEEDLLEFDRFKRGLAVSDADAARFLANHALDLYRECVAMAAQDGVITPEDRLMMRWIQEEAALPEARLASFREEIMAVSRWNAYRRGELPVAKTSQHLEGGEECHWDAPCKYRFETAADASSIAGELIVTNKRVMFASTSKTIQFQPSKIIDMVIFSNCLEVKCDARVGTGHYFVDDPPELESILTGLVRDQRFQQSKDYSSSRSRHIPDDVKREVWDRDAGRCVRCGGHDHLEFGHIVPYARGGADAPGNVQLLCRGCNHLKEGRV